jgi:hypothetical protein
MELVSDVFCFTSGRSAAYVTIETSPNNFTFVSGKSQGDYWLMAKRRGNPNWGKPEQNGPVTPTVTGFAQIVREFNLQPDQYITSTLLREWVRQNKNSKFVPEP